MEPAPTPAYVHPPPAMIACEAALNKYADPPAPRATSPAFFKLSYVDC